MPEESFTQAQYRNTFKNLRQFEHVTVLGSDSSGTHFQWDDSRGERHFGVISDLIGFPIVRADVAQITIPANTVAAILDVALSPALPGAITDYLPFASPNIGVFTASQAELTTLSNLRLRAHRIPGNHSHTIADSSLPVDLVAGTAPIGDVNTVQDYDLIIVQTIVSVSWMIVRA